jgi:Tol biopolymer transport system component
MVDLEGGQSASPLGVGDYRMPRFSPNGRYIAYTSINRQLRVWDRDSGANPPIATGGILDYSFWSRDGRYVYFSGLSSGSDLRDGFRTLADGSGEPEQLFRRQQNQVLLSESLDGTELLVLEATGDRGNDLVIVTLGPDSAVFTNYLVAPWDEGYGTISPDGGRVAYVSNESGVPTVYVRSFPEPVDQLQISEGGGTDPVWAPDGSAVYYLIGGAVWRAELGDSGVRERRMLFEGNWDTRPLGRPVSNWDVHPDGTSFVFVRNPGTGTTEVGTPAIPVEIVVNWFEELLERVGN